jgi:hypothetical protein
MSSLNNRYVEEDKRFPNYLDLPPYDRGKGHMQYKMLNPTTLLPIQKKF